MCFCACSAVGIEGQSCAYDALSHSPSNLVGIRLMQDKLPGIPNIAGFHTSFYATIPEKAYTYPLSRECRESEMRKFGFHGTSIRFVAQKAQEMIATKQVISSDNPTSNLVVCHLGSGASVTAVVDAVDPSLLGLACKSLNKMSTKP